jgi:hypothetical protein
LVFGDLKRLKVAVGGLLISFNHCWVVYEHERLLGGGSFFGAGVVICGVALGEGEAGGCESGVARLRAGAMNGGGLA